MARGWESKSVESQQSEGGSGAGKRKLSTEEREREQKRESLQLSRGRVLHDLENARTEVHRAALENALKFLDDELAKLQ
jgi:ribose 1,5-bisphosphokinase PhnN